MHFKVQNFLAGFKEWSTFSIIKRFVYFAWLNHSLVFNSVTHLPFTEVQPRFTFNWKNTITRFILKSQSQGYVLDSSGLLLFVSFFFSFFLLRNWMDIMEEKVVYFDTYFVGFLQKRSCKYLHSGRLSVSTWMLVLIYPFLTSSVTN